MRNLYISDTHFFDQRIFDLCHRPFKNMADYLNEAKKRWNEKVGKEDTMFLIGDIACVWSDDEIGYLKSLNGTKILVTGNHDLPFLEKKDSSKVFQYRKDIIYLKDDGRDVVLCHYPLFQWVDDFKGSCLVYGHIHNKILPEIKEYMRDRRAYNAGADVIGFVPRTLDELIKLKEESHEAYIN